MEIHVMVDLADRLYTLLEDKLPNLGRRIENAITKELAAEARKESRIAITVKPSAKGTQPAAATTTVTTPATTETTPAEQPETPSAPETPVDAPKQTAPSKTMGEMVREIMHVTRQRFEGEDYKENTDSENYKKYHRQLSAQFRGIAAILGADKPSLISTTEQLERFKQECDALIIDKNGNIAPPPATF